ncbi:MAG: transglutaminase family protein [Cyanobacteria bacterium J055]|nr:MAG: transglutaminase family protein [Cyanobacteria bacterium J055]
MKYQVGCDLEYDVSQTTPFVFNITPFENQHQRIIQENLEIEPSIELEYYVSPLLGNRYFRAIAPAGKFKIQYRAEVEIFPQEEDPTSIPEVPPDRLPLATFYYLYPSRYCQSDRLMRLAQSEFGHLVPDYSRVTAICNWIYENITYQYGSSNSQTSACNTAIERIGVCRDFAHLGIAFCRALNIPARFVTAYAYGLKPADFHACFEAYLGNCWYLFDPTRLVPREGLIRIGTGRDAADVSFATIFGTAQMTKMDLLVDLLDSQVLTETTAAISNF